MSEVKYAYAIIKTKDSENLNLDYSTFIPRRYNQDKSKFIIKFVGENTQLKNIPIYNKETIKKILSLDEWRKTI
jgi:hypothetical protein